MDQEPQEPQNNNPPASDLDGPRASSQPAPPSSATPEPQPQPTEKNWRDELASGDETLRKQLDRFNSSADVAKSWLEMRKKMDSGEYKRDVKFNTEWSDEEKNQWRKENGVPDAADKYSLPEGLVVGEDDKPVLEDFLKTANDLNLPDEYAPGIVDWYFKRRTEAQAAEAREQKMFEQQTEEVLRTKWGPEYPANKNMAQDFAVSRFGDEIGKSIMQAGPNAVEAMAAIAREINPAGTIVPNSSNPGQSIADELAQLQKEIGTPDWFRSPQKQKRYQELVDAQAKIQSRSAS